MKFSLPTAVFALSLLGAADAARIEIRTTTGPGLIPVTSTTYVGDDGKRYGLGGFNDGYSGRKRAHIIYSGGTKKCFRQTRESSKLCGGGEGCYNGVCNRCWEYDFTVATCNW
ncbi:hypothetical protein ACHAPT_010777 [Fusarium lateritium]